MIHWALTQALNMYGFNRSGTAVTLVQKNKVIRKLIHRPSGHTGTWRAQAYDYHRLDHHLTQVLSEAQGVHLESLVFTLIVTRMPFPCLLCLHRRLWQKLRWHRLP